MSQELQSLIILVSALSGALAGISGLIYYALLLRYAKLVKALTGRSIPRKIGILSLVSAAITLGIGIFLLYRMGYVATVGEDFSQRDWVLFDLLVGINLFVIAIRGIEDFKFRMAMMLGKDPEDVTLIDTSFTDLK